jgi:hypothetical protein
LKAMAYASGYEIASASTVAIPANRNERTNCTW